MNQMYSPMPHPEDRIIFGERDKQEASRRPYEKQKGIYILHREPMDTEVSWKEPNEDTYIMEWFECERLLHSLLELEEEFRQRVMDYLWNFYTVALSWELRRCVPLREFDAEGWENEVKLLFKEEER